MSVCGGEGGGGSYVPKSRKIEGGGSAPYIQFLKKCNMGEGGVVGSLLQYMYITS